MRPRTILRIMESYIDYYAPREVMGAVGLIFPLENIIDTLFELYLPFQSDLIGWTVILIIWILLIGFWGEVDEDKAELEKEIEGIMEKEEKQI